MKNNYAGYKVGESMTEAKTARPAFTTAIVPLRREYLVQPAMLDPYHPGKSYFLPEVVPGQEARVVDADYHYEVFNGRRGIVTRYSYFTGHHTILFNGVLEGQFLSREIMKGSRR